MTPRRRITILGLVLASLALAGCTAAPAPSPAPGSTSQPDAGPTEPSWDADLTITREFPDAEGSPVECRIFVRAVADAATASDDALERLDAAKAYLAGSDWADVAVDLDAMPSDEQESRRAQGVSEPELHTMILTGLIYDDVSASGLTGMGVSQESFVICDAS